MILIISLLQSKIILYPIILVGTTLACWVAIRLIHSVMNRNIKRASAILKVDPTRYAFLKHTASALIVIVGILIVFRLIPELNKISVPLFAGAGVLAAIVGFASQQALSNIVGGVFIVIFRPFRVGDTIIVKETYRGAVEDITLRHTVLRNYENKRIVIPNAFMNAEVIENAHLTDQRTCSFVEVNISYSADIDLALQIMREQNEKHPLSIDPRTSKEKSQKKPRTRASVINLNDWSVTLRAWAWANSPAESVTLKYDLLKSVKEEFQKQGIEIPAPQRIIYNKK